MHNINALADALLWAGEPDTITIHKMGSRVDVIISDDVLERTAFYTLGETVFYTVDDRKDEEVEYNIDEAVDPYYIDMANDIISYIDNMGSKESSFYPM